MPKLSTKHENTERILFTDFSGGLNLANPPEFISHNEMQKAENFEFDPSAGLLKVRGGILPICEFEHDVSDIIPVIGTDSMLVKLRNNEVFLVDNGHIVTRVGIVSGLKAASYEYWGDNEILITCGGNLHIYKGSSVSTVDTPGAPVNADIVFTKNGRVLVSEARNDMLRFSGVGDAWNWQDGTDADSFSIEIGYKDSLDMSAISLFAGEIMIFKCAPGQPEFGRIYRLQGNYPDLNVELHSKGSSAWNPNSIATVSNDLLFLTREGLASIKTVTEFGDYKQYWAGVNVNSRLSEKLNNACKIFHVPSRAQVWVWDGQSDTIWVYHYQVGQGAWTTFKFPGIVRAVADIGRLYLSIGRKVYIMNDNLAEDDGEPIKASWRPQTIVRRNQILLKYFMLGYLSTLTSVANLKVDRMMLQLPLYGQGKKASEDRQIAILNMDPLVPSGTYFFRRRANIRRWDITPEIIVTNGRFNLSSVGIEIAEV